MKTILTFFVCFISALGFAQQIVVIDKESGEPINEVLIYNRTKSTTIITNEKGEADLSNFSSIDMLIISHVSYRSFEVRKDKLKQINFIISLVKDTERLNEVLISVFKNKEKKDRIPEQTFAYAKTDIEKASPQTSADLLATVPGIKVQKSQFGGGSPVLRGMESNRVLLVVDGVRLNNAIYRKGHLQNSITVSPSLLERTEIVFGPSSVVYGSDALGGVIHYYTKTPKTAKKFEALNSLFTRIGTVNHEITTNVSSELRFQKWASFTNFSYSSFGDLKMGKNRRHGFADWGKVPFFSDNNDVVFNPNPTANPNLTIQKNTGFQQNDFLQKFYIPFAENTNLTVNIQYSTSSNIPRFDRLMELKSGSLKFAEWYYGPQQRFLAATQLRVRPEKKWLEKGVFTFAYQNIKESRIQRKFNSLNRLYRKENVGVFSLNGDFTVPLTKSKNRNLSYGFEIAYNDVTSVSEGKTLSVSQNRITGFSNNFKVQSRFPDGGSSYSSMAVYTDYRQDLNKKSTLNTGIRLTNTRLSAHWIDQTFISLPDTDIYLKNTALTATIGYVYKPNLDWQISSVLSSGFRSPNIDDVGKVREKNGNVTVPNINLKPEFAYNAELGIQKFFNNKKFGVSLNTYFTILDKYITREGFQLQGNSTIFYDGEMGNIVANVNKGRAYITGFTTSYSGKINDNWNTKGSVTYTKGRSYDTKEPLSSIPPLFGHFELSYKRSKLELTANYQFNAAKTISSYNLTEGIDNHVQTPIINENTTSDLKKYFGTPSWMTFGLRGRYLFNQQVVVQGQISNILDTHYKEFASGVSAPGRNISVSVRVKF